MKKIKRLAVMFLGVISISTTMTSCANMTYEDGYAIGYGLGTLAAYYLDN